MLCVVIQTRNSKVAAVEGSNKLETNKRMRNRTEDRGQEKAKEEGFSRILGKNLGAALDTTMAFSPRHLLYW